MRCEYTFATDGGSSGCQGLTSFHKLIVSQVTPPAGHFHTLNKHKLSEIMAELTHPSETKHNWTVRVGGLIRSYDY